ncbi:hypothetical protein B296_00034344 [Ensete ventricosum]|uniref:Secreted protein n=1 Tax=Ensete ventricosum TaxID=4639 RepID=A0A426XA80_ENSVE|nr:hypothetical protein B296_00034344 [Ensete ventricosum]
MRRCYASLVVAFAHGRALLPWGGSPCWLAAPPRAATWSAGPPTGIVFTSGRRCGWVSRCRLSLMREPCYRRPPLRARCCRRLPLRVAALVRGLGNSRSPPYRWPGHGRPPLQGAWPGREENRSGRLKL